MSVVVTLYMALSVVGLALLLWLALDPDTSTAIMHPNE